MVLFFPDTWGLSGRAERKPTSIWFTGTHTLSLRLWHSATNYWSWSSPKYSFSHIPNLETRWIQTVFGSAFQTKRFNVENLEF
ncbi:hypothetical protein ZEAMMB73_Zm00001d002032 [Zea mays]|jgi:hypothetical protein|uniref:Uncharacterized protein n=1 Tax=Zea mays TaxID=4577 RepID=A0A1D6DVW4_MAIZE|nr:hypothetical protein ZEAMMB73_Zm00001d002032 [Zea mays]